MRLRPPCLSSSSQQAGHCLKQNRSEAPSLQEGFLALPQRLAGFSCARAGRGERLPEMAEVGGELLACMELPGDMDWPFVLAY